MTKIKDFTIERLHNEEDFGYQKRIEVETTHLALESDQAMVGTYKAAILAYDVALKNSTSNSHTSEVVHIDSQTNTAWRGLHAQIKVALKHPNEDCRKTATESNNITHKYGDITKMGYNEKYGCTFNMLQDLNLLAVEKQKKISIYDWVLELQRCYDEFMAATTARTEEDSLYIKGVIKDARENADRAYRALVERVNALALVSGVEPYAVFIANVNVIIDESNAVLAARKTRAKNKEEATPPGEIVEG